VDFTLPAEAISSLAGPLSEQQCIALNTYAEALLRASQRMSLVSQASLASLDEHFIDSAAMLSFRDVSRGTLGDLGSGAGLPGIVLAVLRPDVAVTLVESRRKKIVFLKALARELDLANLEVRHTRIEDLAGNAGFDTAVARALGDVERVLPMCLGAVGPQGSLVLYKGPRWQEEAVRASEAAARVGFTIARTGTIDLPRLHRATTFIEFRRFNPESVTQ
jgi:16S rRNA (guanine527-N7)-methyltransferase